MIMRVMIIGHSYLAEENRKMLTALGEHAEIEVASPRTSKGMIFNYFTTGEAIEGQGWTIQFYDKLVPPKFPDAAYFFKSLTLGLRRFRPDIVHIEGDPFVPFFQQLFLYTKIWASKAKIVCTVKQNTYTSRGVTIDALKDFIARRFIPKVDQFITVNRGVAKIYHDRFGTDPEKMTYCTHLGVDADLFVPRSQGEQKTYLAKYSLARGEALVGYCGRLIEYKGVTDLITAVEILRNKSNKDYRLAILGDGPLKDHLEKFSIENPWLKLVSPVPHYEVADFLKAIDIFVMPPRVLPWHMEHDAHALLEAMSVGVPCVGTECGAIEDVLPGAGFLVSPGSPEDLAVAIMDLLGDEIRLRDYATRGRKRVIAQYSIPAVANTYLEIYRKVLNTE